MRETSRGKHGEVERERRGGEGKWDGGVGELDDEVGGGGVGRVDDDVGGGA